MRASQVSLEREDAIGNLCLPRLVPCLTSLFPFCQTVLVGMHLNHLEAEANVWIGYSSDPLDSLKNLSIRLLALPHEVGNHKCHTARYTLNAVHQHTPACLLRLL